MNTKNHTRSLCAAPAVLGLLLGATACDDGMRHHDWSEDPPAPGQIAAGSIDTGATLTGVVPGEGVGAYVEYTGGGAWHVYASCDTSVSGYACQWDIVVSAADGGSLDQLTSDTPGADDAPFWDDADHARLVTRTTDSFDGFTVTEAVGGALRVDVYLDGSPAPRYLYWVGDGAVHAGAPTNPIDLEPTSP